MAPRQLAPGLASSCAMRVALLLTEAAPCLTSAECDVCGGAAD